MANFEARTSLNVANARVITTSGTNTNVIDVDTSVDWLSVQVNVTAASGTTPSATFSVQWSVDGTTWADADTADSFTAITAAANAVKRFTVKGPFARIKETVSGTTPSFTYTAHAYQR